MTKIKVLHINYSDQGGGAERIARELAEATDSKLLVFKKRTKLPFVEEIEKFPLDSFFTILNKILYKIGIKKDFKRWLSIGEYFNSTYRKLQRNKSYQDCHIVHLHNIHGGYFDVNAISKISHEKKIIWTLHDMWAITGGEAHFFKESKSLISKKEYLNQYPYNSPILDLRRLNLRNKSRIYNSSKNLNIVTYSKWLYREVSETGYFKTDKINYIPHYFSENFHPLGSNNKFNYRVLVFNDAKNTFKGCENIAPLFDWISKNFELHIVGDPLTDQIEYFHYEKFVSDKKLNELLNKIDILVFPSLAETFGLMVLEAMSAGVCVIASNIGGIPEMINHSKNGYLFNPKNPEEIIQILIELKGNIDGIKSEAILTSKNYDKDSTISQYKKLYSDI